MMKMRAILAVLSVMTYIGMTSQKRLLLMPWPLNSHAYQHVLLARALKEKLVFLHISLFVCVWVCTHVRIMFVCVCVCVLVCVSV